MLLSIAILVLTIVLFVDYYKHSLPELYVVFNTYKHWNRNYSNSKTKESIYLIDIKNLHTNLHTGDHVKQVMLHHSFDINKLSKLNLHNINIKYYFKNEKDEENLQYYPTTFWFENEKDVIQLIKRGLKVDLQFCGEYGLNTLIERIFHTEEPLYTAYEIFIAMSHGHNKTIDLLFELEKNCKRGIIYGEPLTTYYAEKYGHYEAIDKVKKLIEHEQSIRT